MPAVPLDVDHDAQLQRICAQIGRLREQRGWNLAELSRKAGVSRHQLAKIEEGSVNPSLGVLLRIATAFTLPLSDLVADR